tara:strand:+ start:5967 stop:6626 length:660 start_codon:yes stop_codon:yes gene_type:complete
MTTTQYSTNEIDKRLESQRADLNARLALLHDEHGTAALKAAEGDTVALQVVPDIKRRMLEINDSLASLDAAQRKLNDRKAKEALDKQLGELQAVAEQVPGLAMEILARWDDLDNAIQQLGEAWRSFEAARKTHEHATRVCAVAGRHSPDQVIMTSGIHDSTARAFAGRLLWEATNGEIEPDVNRPRDSASVRESLARELERTINQSKENARMGSSKLRS